MRKILILFLLFALQWRVVAQEDSAEVLVENRMFTLEQVPNVHVQDRRQYVSDPSDLLSPATRGAMNEILGQLSDSTGIQAVVVMLPSIGEEDIFDFAHNLFMDWGVGEVARDNGLLVLYVADQRKLRFHVGYGLEGVLPDALCKRIQTTAMIPAFKEGDIDRGMLAGVQELYRVLESSMNPHHQEDETLGILAALAVMVFMCLLFIWVFRKSQRRVLTCRKCDTPGALRLSSKDYYRARDGHRHRKEVYVCSHCGAVEMRDRDVDDEDGGGLLDGMVIGSMLGGGGRGGFGGGGFSGGSFGGGSSGGGGATSGW